MEIHLEELELAKGSGNSIGGRENLFGGSGIYIGEVVLIWEELKLI